MIHSSCVVTTNLQSYSTRTMEKRKIQHQMKENTCSESFQLFCLSKVIYRGAESSKKSKISPPAEIFPRGVFSPTSDLLYFKRKTQPKTCNSFLPFFNVRTTSEFFLFVLFSSGSKQPNQVKLI